VQHDPENESNYAIDPQGLPSALFRTGETGERFDLAQTSEPLQVADVPNLQMLTAWNADRRVRGQDLKRAAATTDLASGRPAISFTLDERGAIAMAKLTTDHLPDPASGSFHYLAIVLDGKALSAPRLQSTISKEGQITGDFTQAEVELLVGTLRSGRLPARMQAAPLSEEMVEPEH
jgi:preprotein translocase subunit SecD